MCNTGGCDVNHRVHPYFIPEKNATYDQICVNAIPGAEGALVPNLPAPGPNYQCVGGHKLHSGAMWLGLAGFFLMVILMSRGFRGAIIVGVLFSTIIAWIPGHSASYLGHTSHLPGAAEHLSLAGPEIEGLWNALDSRTGWRASRCCPLQLSKRLDFQVLLTRVLL